MNTKKIIIGLVVFGLSFSTVNVFANNSTLTISDLKLNTNLPSASGQAFVNGKHYVIGDDSPYLFTLDENFSITDKKLIKDYPIGENGRIPKAVKPDYEALSAFKYKHKDSFLILGSGSKSNVREFGHIISADGSLIKEFKLTDFYFALHSAANFDVNTSLNIEGVTLADNKFVLLNRGNSGDNIIFTVDKDEFIDYIEGKKVNFHSIKSYAVTLPSISGNISGFSGVDYLPEENMLILTSSVECTNDPINDGKILGSFVGYVEMNDLKNNLDLTKNFKLIENNNQPFITKAESITVKDYSNDVLSGSICSDNDDGTSEFFNFNFTIDN